MLFVRRINLNPLRLAHHTRGQLHDARRKRGAEHHGLLALNGELIDFGQVIGKAEVEHAVGFVNDEELHLIEFDLHAALQVKQTAWRSHHQIGVLQFSNLQLVRNAANNVGNAQAAAMAHQVDGVSANLLGQFTGRAQNQRAWGGGFEVAHVGRVFALWLFSWGFTASDSLGRQALKLSALETLSFFLLLQECVQHRQQKSSGFATTGLAGHQQVGELCFFVCILIIQGLHGFGNGCHLDGGRLGKAHVCHGLQQLFGQAQFYKAVWLRCDGIQRCFQHVSGVIAVVVIDVKACVSKRVIANFKRISHVFFSTFIHAAATNKSVTQKNLHGALLHAASFMVNKTSTS